MNLLATGSKLARFCQCTATYNWDYKQHGRRKRCRSTPSKPLPAETTGFRDPVWAGIDWLPSGGVAKGKLTTSSANATAPSTGRLEQGSGVEDGLVSAEGFGLEEAGEGEGGGGGAGWWIPVDVCVGTRV